MIFMRKKKKWKRVNIGKEMTLFVSTGSKSYSMAVDK